MRLRHILVDFLVSFSSSSHFDYNRQGRQRSKVSIHSLLHVSSVVDPVPNFTKQNPLCRSVPRITLEIELFTVFNSFMGPVKIENLRDFHFYSS